MVKIMKLGEMKYDIPIERIGNGHWNYNFFEKRVILKEGKRINANSSKYDYLRKDDMVKTDDDFYESIVYAYMVDWILKNHPELNKYYDELWAERKRHYEKNLLNHQETKEHWNTKYLAVNYDMVIYYRDYLREQADPGCLERERQKEEKELQESIAFHEAIAKMDAERHPHVECPYCHSTNTEKISTVSRAVSVSLVGAASSKLGKQWHCNNCKSDF